VNYILLYESKTEYEKNRAIERLVMLGGKQQYYEPKTDSQKVINLR